MDSFCDRLSNALLALTICVHHTFAADAARLCHTEKLNKEHGWEIKIHIDGASGGFIAPFQYPDLLWCVLMFATAWTCTCMTLTVTSLLCSLQLILLRLEATRVQ